MRLAGLSCGLAGAWLLPVAWPQLAIIWRPTETQLLWAEGAPWFLYVGTVRVILAVRRSALLEQTWKDSRSLHRISRIEFTPEVVRVNDGLVENVYQWVSFKRYHETNNLMILYNIDDLPSVVFSKRGITDDGVLNQLRALISDHIREGIFAPPKTAFTVIQNGGLRE